MAGIQPTNTPPCIAVIQKWRPYWHGTSEGERKFINYLSTKYLLCWDTHYYDSDSSDEEYDEYSPTEQIDNALDFADPNHIEQLYDGQQEAWSTHIACIIRKTYKYKDRTFCIRNYGIEKFQQKWRDYYKKKLAFVKNVRNLRYRQIYGKYPRRFKKI